MVLRLGEQSSLEEDRMNVHVFVTIDYKEIRILYDDFDVSFYNGQVQISQYKGYDRGHALAAHRRSPDWEQLL